MMYVAIAGLVLSFFILGIYLGKQHSVSLQKHTGLSEEVEEDTDGEVYSVCTRDKLFIKKITQIDDLYGALYNTVWGDFYQKMKHGDINSEFTSAAEAVYAYRDFISQELSEHNIDLDDY